MSENSPLSGVNHVDSTFYRTVGNGGRKMGFGGLVTGELVISILVIG